MRVSLFLLAADVVGVCPAAPQTASSFENPGTINDLHAKLKNLGFRDRESSSVTAKLSGPSLIGPQYGCAGAVCVSFSKV